MEAMIYQNLDGEWVLVIFKADSLKTLKFDSEWQAQQALKQIAGK